MDIFYRPDTVLVVSDLNVVLDLLSGIIRETLLQAAVDMKSIKAAEADDEIVFPPERWAVIFRSHAWLILRELGEYLGYSLPPLLERLIEDAQKINQRRPTLQETLATAMQPRCES